MPETYDNALEQANLIIRYFLGMGNIWVGKGVPDRLPAELASIDKPEDIATEYMHYRQFMHVWDIFERIAEVIDAEVADEWTKDAKVAWLNEYEALVDEVFEKSVKLLTTEWLVSDVSRVDGDRRRRELIRVRQILIPELVIKLHNILYDSRARLHKCVRIDQIRCAFCLTCFPRNLTRTFHLANIVADSRHKLYEDFVGGNGLRLREYLGNVRQAILGGLEGGGSDPFRILGTAN
jgi:nuclear pore complex protein Nup107